MGGFSYRHKNAWVRLGYKHAYDDVGELQHEATEPVRVIKQGHPSGVPDLKYLLKEGYIIITKNEIQDRSRADIITKVIAVLQTIWFLLQVGARWAQGLAITELEIITVAFAVLNFCTYLAWWSKPLRVQYPIRIQREPESYQSPNHEAKGLWEHLLIYNRHYWAPLARMSEEVVKLLAENFQSIKLHSGHLSSSISTFVSYAITYLRTGIMKFATYLSMFMKVVFVAVKVLLAIVFMALCIVLGIVGGLVLSVPMLIVASPIIAVSLAVSAILLPLLIVAIPFAIVQRLPIMVQKIMQIGQMAECILLDDDNEKLITTISSGFRGDSSTLYLLVYALGVVFGAIHCIPWVFQFPTTTELLLWRISSIAITATPLVFGLFHSLPLSQHSPGWRSVVHVVFIGISIAYVIFRITLIVLALMALRNLPASAYQSVQWSYFMAHIG
ncbi:hypothetical protein VNI00_016613 [Paramarasmius palmivorus]|uniref:Uncharacterized protein n=1 Tax=Paramarasmius palmivorus TaxID=297713 RepID=A0AAW0BC85_9AGAR